MNRADLEFYEAHLVMTAAKALAPPDVDWDQLSDRKRIECLDRAGDVLLALIKDRRCMERLHKLAIPEMDPEMATTLSLAEQPCRS